MRGSTRARVSPTSNGKVGDWVVRLCDYAISMDAPSGPAANTIRDKRVPSGLDTRSRRHTDGKRSVHQSKDNGSHSSSNIPVPNSTRAPVTPGQFGK